MRELPVPCIENTLESTSSLSGVAPLEVCMLVELWFAACIAVRKSIGSILDIGTAWFSFDACPLVSEAEAWSLTFGDAVTGVPGI